MKPLIVNYSADDFQIDINEIEKHITDHYQPDLIMGIARGGAMPAVVLSHRLDLPVYITNFSTRDYGWKLEAALPEIVKGKKLLIVDDLIDSGVSIKQMIEYVNPYVHNVAVGVLMWNTDVEMNVPVYTARKFSRAVFPHWFEFFWERKN